ncbi:MAG: WYL domain-containing protein, partial [Deltaproteobacteria bacterium]|nr:WYL domain-containing protein [Deltaproteobacteria bacterium]
MLSQNPSEVYFAFLDVETTGLDPASGDKICEIAVIKTIDGQLADEFVSIINPGRNIPERAISIHGITQVMVNRAPFFRDIAKDLLDFLNDAVIVAHNAKFDLEFLRSELKNLTLSLPENEVIDTLGIARRYYKFPSNNLGEIAKSIGLPIDEQHRALADVTTTKDIFEYFLKDLDRRGIRLNRLKDILKLQGRAVELKTTNELVLPTEIERALRDKGKLEIKYLSAYKEETSVRVIEPFDISVSKTNTYIHAYCHQRKERCTFRLDRILDIKA